MDLRHYYSKIRELEAQIGAEDAVIVSRETGDGGIDGTLTQVSARLAATMVVQGTARLATFEEKEQFLAVQAEAKRIADQMANAERVQFTVLSSADLERLRGVRKPKEESTK